MAREGAQQAMTSERLAEIRARAENLAEVREVGPHNFSDLEPGQLYAIAMAYHEDIPAVLAEVERLRAREAALVERLRQLDRQALDVMHMQMLMADKERSGGDGE